MDVLTRTNDACSRDRKDKVWLLLISQGLTFAMLMMPALLPSSPS